MAVLGTQAEPASSMPSTRFCTSARGWIGVALASLIASAGVPTRHPANAEPAALVLRLQLAECNAAAEAFRRDHGHWPGLEPGPALEPSASVAQLRQDLTGPRSTRPPYLSSWPKHPATGSSHVRQLQGGPTVLEEGTLPAWTWRPSTGQIASDPLTGQPRTTSR